MPESSTFFFLFFLSQAKHFIVFRQLQQLRRKKSDSKGSRPYSIPKDERLLFFRQFFTWQKIT
jgi:hypothetical protein